MTGTKTERSPGVWRLRVFVGTDPRTGNPRQLSRTFRGTRQRSGHGPPPLRRRGRHLHRSSPARPRPSRSISTAGSTTSHRYARPPRSEATDSKSGASRPRSARCRWTSSALSHLDRSYRQWLEEGLAPSSCPPPPPGAVHRPAPGRQTGPRHYGRHRSGQPAATSTASSGATDPSSHTPADFRGRAPRPARLGRRHRYRRHDRTAAR